MLLDLSQAHTADSADSTAGDRITLFLLKKINVRSVVLAQHALAARSPQRPQLRSGDRCSARRSRADPREPKPRCHLPGACQRRKHQQPAHPHLDESLACGMRRAPRTLKSRRCLGCAKTWSKRWASLARSSRRRCCSGCKCVRPPLLATLPRPLILPRLCRALLGRRRVNVGLRAAPQRQTKGRSQAIQNPEDFITACESSWRPELLLEGGVSDHAGGIMPSSPAGAFLRRCRLAFASRPFEVGRTSCAACQSSSATVWSLVSTP